MSSLHKSTRDRFLSELIFEIITILGHPTHQEIKWFLETYDTTFCYNQMEFLRKGVISFDVISSIKQRLNYLVNKGTIVEYSCNNTSLRYGITKKSTYAREGISDLSLIPIVELQECPKCKQFIIVSRTTHKLQHLHAPNLNAFLGCEDKSSKIVQISFGKNRIAILVSNILLGVVNLQELNSGISLPYDSCNRFDLRDLHQDHSDPKAYYRILGYEILRD